MKLSTEEVSEFRNLYQTHLGEKLALSAAYAMAVCFLNFIQALEAPVDSDRDVAFMEEFMTPHRSRRAIEPATAQVVRDGHRAEGAV